MNIAIYILIGLAAGLIGGFFGLGGGVVLIPTFVYMLGFTQHEAQGTALAAMVPPITLLAALRYYYAGNVKVQVAFLACLGFIVGGLIGAHFVQQVADPLLKKSFGFVLLFLALRMIFGK